LGENVLQGVREEAESPRVAANQASSVDIENNGLVDDRHSGHGGVENRRELKHVSINAVEVDAARRVGLPRQARSRLTTEATLHVLGRLVKVN
jgi:hypothetical protein